MKKIIFCFFLSLAICNAQAQENVADIGHAFVMAIKNNDIEKIKTFFIPQDIAYHILPKSSAGMTMQQKNEQYLLPLYQKFEENFNKITQQINDKNVSTSKLNLFSYKLEKPQEKMPMQGMNLYIKYYDKEYNIPISVIEIEERWYILEILFTSNLFE